MQGGEARGAGVAVLDSPAISRGRKVWRFRFTYTIPEGGHVPFSTTLKCKAGLEVSVSNPHYTHPVMPPSVVAAWWVCPPLLGGGARPGAASLAPESLGSPSHSNLHLCRTPPSSRRSWR